MKPAWAEPLLTELGFNVERHSLDHTRYTHVDGKRVNVWDRAISSRTSAKVWVQMSDGFNWQPSDTALDMLTLLSRIQP